MNSSSDAPHTPAPVYTGFTLIIKLFLLCFGLAAYVTFVACGCLLLYSVAMFMRPLVARGSVARTVQFHSLSKELFNKPNIQCMNTHRWKAGFFSCAARIMMSFDFSRESWLRGLIELNLSIVFGEDLSLLNIIQGFSSLSDIT